MRAEVLAAMAAFLILAAGQSFAACDVTPSTDCNVVSVSMSADAGEYTIGSTAVITLKVTARGNPDAVVAGLRTVDINFTKRRPVFEPDVVKVEYLAGVDIQNPVGNVAERTIQVNIAGYQPGLYTFNAIIEKIGTASGPSQVYDAVKVDNHASVYVTLKKPSTQVPEINTLLAIAAALSVLFVVARK